MNFLRGYRRKGFFTNLPFLISMGAIVVCYCAFVQRGIDGPDDWQEGQDCRSQNLSDGVESP